MNQVLRHAKNTALTLVFPLTDPDGQPITGAGGLDTEESHDGSVFADTANEMAEIGSTGFYVVTITAGELNYDTIVIDLQTSTGGIMPLSYEIHTYTPTEDITLAELAQGQPSATPTLRNALMLLYMALRNLTTTSATLLEVNNNAGTVIAKSTIGDDGSDFTRAKMVSGP
ncbi:hypothetical protein LCGC14_2423300 [marine sediment metagenome]|uniref:Uncharacterized protein n=1 Tax=marine sediment metagenome TaxID=412755 RepID=A0A0F9EI93_9ZZZZ